MTAVDAAIESQYVFPALGAEREQVYSTIAELSAEVAAELAMRADIPYGSHPRERIDLFPAGRGAPMLVFLHGGYWSGSAKESFRYVARPFVARGVAVAIMGYPLAPETPLAGIVASVCHGIDRLANEGSRFLGDRPQAICVGGHSAGGHLATVATYRLAPRERHPSSRIAIAGCACLSGIFDLRPLLRTSVANRARLDRNDARTLSPALMAPARSRLVACVGANDGAGFLLQAEQHASHRAAHGAETATSIVPGATHYGILLDPVQDDSRFVDAVCGLLERPAKRPP